MRRDGAPWRRVAAACHARLFPVLESGRSDDRAGCASRAGRVVRLGHERRFGAGRRFRRGALRGVRAGGGRLRRAAGRDGGFAGRGVLVLGHPTARADLLDHDRVAGAGRDPHSRGSRNGRQPRAAANRLQAGDRRGCEAARCAAHRRVRLRRVVGRGHVLPIVQLAGGGGMLRFERPVHGIGYPRAVDGAQRVGGAA